ncbi:MAG: tape measure protein, partial [Paramuribaculum sp.]|nr:tape measure protein [Paramuribaculum sp.]
MLAGAEIEDSFKKRIYDAAQSVNGFSENIIEQKNHIHSLESELRKLKDSYKALPKNPVGEDYFKEQHLAKQIRELNAEIGVEKDALFGLTQAKARAALEAKKLSDEYKSLKKEAGDVTDVIGELKDNLLKTGAKVLGGIGIGVGIKDFASQVISVRGEFQGIETSLKVLLKDEEKAAALMGEIKKFAAVSPLDLKSTAAAAQMMLGFNIEAEKVPRFLQAIGDVSMGDSAKFNSLTLAFSQMSATGKLMGQDLNQMINAGFNPLQAIADKTGKSIAELKEQMSKGAISAEMVQQAFIDATDAGGKFYNMSAEASKIINGQLSMLQDAIDAMFNEIGESSEGIIQGSISMATKLVENYQTVGIVLSGLIATYGAYRAAIMLVIAAEKGYTIAQMAQYKWLLLCEKAQKLLNASMLANPYVLLATAVVAVGTAIWAYANHASEAEKAQKKLTDAVNEADSAFKSEESNVNLLFNKLRKAKEGTEEYAAAQKMIIDQYGSYLNGLIDEKNRLLDVELAYQRVTAAARESANARAMESHTSELKTQFQEEYGESMGDIIEIIRNKVKGNRANTLIELVRRDIDAYGGITSDTQTALGDALGEKRSNRGGWNDASQVRKILNNVSKIREAQKTYNEGMEAANAAFGTMGNEFTSYSKEELQNMQAVLEYQMEGANDAEEIILSINGQVKETYKTLNDARLALAKIKEASKVKSDEKKVEQYNNLKATQERTKKELDEATSALKEMETSPDKYSKDDYEKAKQRKATAESEYKKWHEKADKNAPKRLEKEDEGRNKLARQLEDLERKNQSTLTSLLAEGKGKRLKIIEEEYEERIKATDRQKDDWIKANKKAKMPGLNANGLTQEQADALKQSNELALEQKNKATLEVYEDEAASMRNFLKEYGTFQQQKLAIAEEYAKKIEKATTEGEKLSLAKERDKATRSVDVAAMKAEIDWRGLFTGVGSL